MALSMTTSMSTSTAEASLNRDGEDPVRTIERTGKSRSLLRNMIPPFLMFLLFLGIWYAYSGLRYDIPAQRINALPFPHEVIRD